MGRQTDRQTDRWPEAAVFSWNIFRAGRGRTLGALYNVGDLEDGLGDMSQTQPDASWGTPIPPQKVLRKASPRRREVEEGRDVSWRWVPWVRIF